MPRHISITLARDIHGNENTKIHYGSVKEIMPSLVADYGDRGLSRVAQISVRDTIPRSRQTIQRELVMLRDLSGLVELSFSASGLLSSDYNEQDVEEALKKKPELRHLQLAGLPISLHWSRFTEMQTITLRDCFLNGPLMEPRELFACIAEWRLAKGNILETLHMSSLSHLVNFASADPPAAPPSSRKSLAVLRRLVLEDTYFKLRNLLEHLTPFVTVIDIKLVTTFRGDYPGDYQDIVRHTLPATSRPLSFLPWRPREVEVAASEDKVTVTARGTEDEERLVLIAPADPDCPGSRDFLFRGALRSLGKIFPSDIHTLRISGPLDAVDEPAWSHTLEGFNGLRKLCAVDTEQRWTGAPLQAALDVPALVDTPLLCRMLQILSLQGLAYTSAAVHRKLPGLGPVMKRRIEKRGAAKLKKLELEVVIVYGEGGQFSEPYGHVRTLNDVLDGADAIGDVHVRTAFSGSV